MLPLASTTMEGALMEAHEQATTQEAHTAVLVSTAHPSPGEGEEDTSYPHLTPEEAEAIFLVAVSEIPTQPLLGASPQQRAATRYLLLVTLLLFCSMAGGAVLGIVTYPSVTIDLVPVSKRVSITAQLPLLPTRTLAPVTVTETLSQPTTGHGHQDATTAAGVLTFYNGRFSPQMVTSGSVLTSSDGIKVTTDQTVSIPAASLQQVGVSSVAAHALRAGSSGNIPALAINLAISGDLLAKNPAAFVGGRDARDYPAVAKADVGRLTAELQHALAERIPQAFPRTPEETVTPTHCTWRESVDHALGQATAVVTETARYTCTGVAYNTNQLQQSATTAFTAATRPGARYELVGSVQARVIAASPAVTASIGGLWVYRLSEDDQQVLAAKLAGETAQQAQQDLLHTGVFSQVTVPSALPRDPAHIHFQVFIGL
jgi:hypothetical protein